MTFELKTISFGYRSKAYGVRTVFSDCSLTVQSGECVAIAGEEGSGKSTLLQLMDGLLRPESGTVCIDGEDIWLAPKHLHRIRRRVGFAFQFPEMQFFCENVMEELLVAAKHYALSVGRGELNRVLEQCGLPLTVVQRSPFTLSMGEARRVALASIMLHRPDAILLDEPTAGLDAFGMKSVTALLRSLRSEGKTIALVSHDRDLIDAVADRVVVLDQGRIAKEELLR